MYENADTCTAEAYTSQDHSCIWKKCGNCGKANHFKNIYVKIPEKVEP